MNNEKYKLCSYYQFECDGLSWHLTVSTEDRLEFEEGRKNGQEDTHTYVEANKNSEGCWVIDEESRKHIEFYQGGELVETLEAFLNENPPPTMNGPRREQPTSPGSWEIPCSCGCPGSVAVADIQPGDRDVRSDEEIDLSFRPYRKTFTRSGGRLFEHRAGDEGGRDTREIAQQGRIHSILPR